MSTQNLISLNLTPDQWTAIDGAVAVVENHLGLQVALPKQRTKVPRMGPKSEQFCRQTLSALAQNPLLVPGSVDMAGVQADLVSLDQLLPRLQRLRQVTERAGDLHFALASDVMAGALQGYKLLKFAGRSHGLDGLRVALAERFSKAPRKTVAEEKPA
jgi:hypothetical protein